MRRIVRRSAQPPAAGYGDVHPVLARVYAARRVASAQDLDYSLARLHPFSSLSGLEQAVDLLHLALEQGWRVLVVGDFDADGATSSALVVRALRAMGAAHVGYLVPNRFEYGYGLTPEIVEVAALSRPDLIITVDNGISSLRGVQAARQRGIRVLVTDHHLPGPHLPEADAIVNPNQPGDAFPSKHLAGVGVAFYLMAGLRARLRETGWLHSRALPEPNLAQHLDLVALGTVADVVPLDHNNRVLVAQGLARIRAGRCCPGIRALLTVAGRDPARIGAADLGYAVGPRLNAAGRLADMAQGIECLLCQDEQAASVMARELDRLNRERRSVEEQMQSEALAILEGMQLEGDGSLPTGLCLYDPAWHQGVIGILASRIKERLHRPVIAFAPAGDGEIKGSARSVPGLHIRDALEALAAREPTLLTRFGGHAMAAGLSLHASRFEDFAQAFDAQVRRHLQPEDLEGVIYSDGELAAGELDLPLAEALREAGPWGQTFPEPVFDGRFQVLQRRVVGEKHVKLTVRAAGGERPTEAIAFNALEAWPGEAEHLHLAYRLDVNEYRGRRSVQLVVEHAADPDTPRRL